MRSRLLVNSLDLSDLVANPPNYRSDELVTLSI